MQPDKREQQNQSSDVRPGIMCENCHVRMRWYYSRLTRVELGRSFVSYYQCPNCHGIASKVSLITNPSTE